MRYAMRKTVHVRFTVELYPAVTHRHAIVTPFFITALLYLLP